MGSSASRRASAEPINRLDDAPLYLPACSDVYQDMNQPLSHYYILSSGNTFAVGSPDLQDQQHRRRVQKEQEELLRLRRETAHRDSRAELCGPCSAVLPDEDTAPPPPPPCPRVLLAHQHHGTASWRSRRKRRGQTGLGVLRFALRSGCRMVELTLHNGSAGWLGQLFDGQGDDAVKSGAAAAAAANNGAESCSGDPVVYHNANVARGLPFRACLEVIAQHAFDASDFPLVLALDNHCDARRQGRTAQLLRGILGDMLLVPERRYHVLPSPAELRRKVVVLVNDRNRQRRRYAGMAPALRELALLEAATFKSLYASRFATFAAAATYSQAELEAHAQNGASTMMEHTFRHVALLRTEDARVDAPNADPAHFWRQGAQLTAIYWPHWDAALWVAMGLFRTENGGCGYVLKPDSLRCENVPRGVYSLPAGKSRALLVLRVRSLTAPAARLPPHAPFSIVVTVHGAPCDEVTLTSPLARATAGQTVLHHTFRLRIAFPQLAVVLVRVCWGGPQADLPVTSTVTGDALAGKPLPTEAEAAEAAAALSQTISSVHSRTGDASLLMRLSWRGSQRASLRASWRSGRNAQAPASKPDAAARLHLDLPIVAHNAFAVNTLQAGAMLLPLLDRKCRPLLAAHLGVDITYMSPEEVATLALRRRSDADSNPDSPSLPRTIHVTPLGSPSLPEEDGFSAVVVISGTEEGSRGRSAAGSPPPLLAPERSGLMLSPVLPEWTRDKLRSASMPNVHAGKGVAEVASRPRGGRMAVVETADTEMSGEPPLLLQASRNHGSMDTLLPALLRGLRRQGPLLGAAPLKADAEGGQAARGEAKHEKVTYDSDKPWPGEC